MEGTRVQEVTVGIVFIVEEASVLIHEVVAALDPDNEQPSRPDQPGEQRRFIKAPIRQQHRGGSGSRPTALQPAQQLLLGLGAACLVVGEGNVLHEVQQGKRPAAVRDLGPEDRPSGQKGPVEHHGHEGDGAQASEQKREVSGKRGVEGSGAEGGIT
jgi:hypothetical protein